MMPNLTVLITAASVFSGASFAQNRSPDDRINGLTRFAAMIETIVQCGIRPASWGEKREQALIQLSIEIADRNASSFGGQLAARQFAVAAAEQALEAAATERRRYGAAACQKAASPERLQEFDDMGK